MRYFGINISKLRTLCHFLSILVSIFQMIRLLKFHFWCLQLHIVRPIYYTPGFEIIYIIHLFI